MSIKRYIATKDNTITNAFKSSLETRGTGSNMGLSDVTEVFSIYGQTTSGSAATKTSELSRVLYEFPITSSAGNILADRTSGEIPASGSVSFFLKLYNAEHAFTLPRDFTLVVSAVSRSWSEGIGLDMEEYTDLDTSNWISASNGTAWTNYGGDYHASPVYTSTFDDGTEDLEVDITELVEQWIKGSSSGGKNNYGIGLFLTSSQEAYFSSSSGQDDPIGYQLHNPSGAKESFYTKKFFARGTEFFFKRPIIEARWDDSKKDNAGNFYLSSSLASATDNLNTLYLYNLVRGQLKNIPAVGTNPILLSVYGTLGGDKITLPIGGGVATNGDFNVTGGFVSTGIYSASFAYTGSATTIYPVWHSGSTEFHTASAVTVDTFSSGDFNPNPKYISKITNLKPIYDTDELARFRLYVRQKDWNPTIYTKATTNIETEIIEDAYYKVFRVVDELEVIPYGTGSLNHTRLSYDASGSYFDLNMDLLQPDYAYAIKFVYHVNGAYHEQQELFKFRVE